MYLQHNEFVVYNTAQVRMRYLVHVAPKRKEEEKVKPKEEAKLEKKAPAALKGRAPAKAVAFKAKTASKR